MAKRPWVTPLELREYSEITSVQKRSEERLMIDITRAEQYVITYTHCNFKEYEDIPIPVKSAVMILAEAYANNSVAASKELKSETFDDYSYTSEATTIDVGDLDLAALLDDYVVTQASGNVTMRLRRL